MAERRCEDAFPAAALALVPLAVVPFVDDAFLAPKWHLLGLVTAAWLWVEASRPADPWLPGVLRGVAPALFVALGLSLADVVRSGPAWAAQPLLRRLAFLALVACFYRCSLRDAPALTRLQAPLVAATTLVVAVGLPRLVAGAPDAQAAGLAWASQSLLFGNVNLEAEFLAFAAVFALLAVLAPGPRPPRAWIAATLLVAGLALVELLQLRARSATLGVGLALVARLMLAPVPRRRRRLLAAKLAVLVGVALFLARSEPDWLGRAKADGAAERMRLWAATLELVEQHPLGIGAGNFEHNAPPFVLRATGGGSLVYRSPHNEWLRLVAEEGVVVAALVWGALAAALASALWRRARDGTSPGDPRAMLVVPLALLLVSEATFQFPLHTAFGTAAVAAVLGGGFAWLDGAGAAAAAAAGVPAARGRARRVALALAALLGGGFLLDAAASLAASQRQDLSRQRLACALQPRLLGACVQAAYLEARAGDLETAASGLTRVLSRAPHTLPALALLGDVRLRQGETQLGCALLRRHDALLGTGQRGAARLPAECAPPP